MKEQVRFICTSVVGGWQTALVYGDVEVAFGPVFDDVTRLWNWQGVNLPHRKHEVSK